MASEILQKMLDAIPDKYDKREGSFIYDALAPIAEQFKDTDTDIDEVKEKLAVSNLKGDELTLRVKDATGITRRTATFATGIVTLTGTGTINQGDLFETEGGVQFSSLETKDIIIEGTVNIKAFVPGANGNVPSNTITLFPVTLTGFTAVNNTSTSINGFNQETDEDLIVRYYERLQTPSTSGNKNDYLNWSKEVQGVGAVKVIPLWNGNNTVKVVIIDSERQPASTELVSLVQEYIDPSSEGLGEGRAPIGAQCNVVSATGVTVNISATITLTEGYTLQNATDNIEANLTKYLKDIAFKENIVSYAKIGSSILDSEGVSDYNELTVNSGTSNISIGNEEVATLGTVSVNE